jgi:uncharacterized membrane protein (UPF0127 family)
MNLKRHHVLYALLALCLIAALIVLTTPRTHFLSYTASTTPQKADTAMNFEVVTTQAAQEKGLGGRADIPENYGMLFVFPADEKVGFWMKDMLVPIDIVWLADDGTILGIEDTVSPSTYPEAFYPPRPVKYVLETKAGEMRRKGWSAGTKVPLPLPYAM